MLDKLLRVLRGPLGWLVLIALVAAVAVVALNRRGGAVIPANSYHVVKRSDFLVSLVEGGTLRATQELIIRNELEGNTQIVSLVPEGTTVKKGDLLVELDSSGLRERILNQEVTVQNSDLAFTKAKEDLAIQKLTQDAAVKDAELRLEFADSDLEKYKDGDWPQAKRAIEARITIAEEEVQRAQDRLNWTKMLEAKGYATKDELKADTLTVKRQDITISQAKEDLRLAQVYDYPKRVRLLEAGVDSAKLDLLRVKQKTTATLASYEADVKSKDATLALQQERFQQMKDQLEMARIVAPQEGLVVYASGSSSSSGILIEPGATVRQKQDIIKLPDVTQMMIEIRVHESHVRQVKPGLLSYVTIDSLPDQVFTGVVKKVAVLPDTSSRYYNPNLKVYVTEVWINESLSDIKPGVSGRAEILVTNLVNVLTVPIQAVTTLRGQQVCFARRDGQEVPVAVEVGLFNERMIEIRSGLRAGDQVLLSALANGDNISLGGSVVGKEENGTNRPPLPKFPTEDAEKDPRLTVNEHEQLPPGVRRNNNTSIDASTSRGNSRSSGSSGGGSGSTRPGSSEGSGTRTDGGSPSKSPADTSSPRPSRSKPSSGP